MPRRRRIRSVDTVLSVVLAVFLTPSFAAALIVTSQGNAPVHDMGWPEGVLALANLEKRLEYWEGPPFGGGEYHFGYRAESTEDLNRALELFAAVRTPVRELFVHKGERKQGMAVEEPLDWTLTVWVHENWNRLQHAPRPAFLTDPGPIASVGTPVPAPRIDLYLAPGNAVEWEKVRVPEGVVVLDVRSGPAPAAIEGTAEIAGTVYDLATAKPVKGATVSLEPAGEGRPHPQASTAAAGTFHFENVPVGFYCLRIVADGYASRTVRLDCVGADSRANARIGLGAASQLGGCVVDYQGKPVSGVVVTALRLAATDLSPYVCPDAKPVVTDKDGRFTLAALPAGYAELKLKRPGAQLFGQTTSLLYVPSRSAVRLRLEELGTIAGIVPEEQRVDGQVHVHPASGEVYGFAYTANCAEDGSFTIENVPPGEYRVGTDMLRASGAEHDGDGIVFVVVRPGETVRVDFPSVEAGSAPASAP